MGCGGKKDSRDEKEKKKKGKENFKMSPSLKRMCSFSLVFCLVADEIFSLQLWNIYMKFNRRAQFNQE